jgi:hypothetical protein
MEPYGGYLESGSLVLTATDARTLTSEPSKTASKATFCYGVNAAWAPLAFP